MTKRSSTIFGLLLIFLGAQAFVYRAVLPIFGLAVSNLWPLFVANMGLLLVAGPFMARQRRGLGGLFIPSVPIIMTSGLLLIANLTNWWGLWDRLWPLVVLALALGFVAAARWLRNEWLLIPAMIIGVNGLVFLFCTITGWWEVWAAIWPIELLTIGLSLLVVNYWVQANGLARAGVILSILSGFGFAIMALVLSGWVSVLAALILIGSGIVLIGHNDLALTMGESGSKEKLAETYSGEDVMRIKETA
jgi:hypothetical protein